MTYIEFLIYFTLSPIAILLIILKKHIDGVFIKWTVIVSIIAFLATTLWDNFAVYSGIWHFPEEKTLGIKLWYVPIEEYAFFFLQTYLTALVQLAFLVLKNKKNYSSVSLGFLFLPFLFLSGNEILKYPFGNWNYLFHLFSWSGFFILIQFIWGRKKLIKYIPTIIVPALIMTVYFSIADSISIGNGIWDFDKSQTIGLKVFNVPLEEILFFLMTNLMITVAMILFLPEHFLKMQNGTVKLKNGIKKL